jgi:hypothetical protein
MLFLRFNLWLRRHRFSVSPLGFDCWPVRELAYHLLCHPISCFLTYCTKGSYDRYPIWNTVVRKSGPHENSFFWVQRKDGGFTLHRARGANDSQVILNW